MQQLALPAVGGAWEVPLVFWEAQLTPLSHPHSPANCGRVRCPPRPACHLPAADPILATQPLSLLCPAQPSHVSHECLHPQSAGETARPSHFAGAKVKAQRGE